MSEKRKQNPEFEYEILKTKIRKNPECDENFYCDYRIKNIQAQYTNSLGFTNVARKGFFAD